MNDQAEDFLHSAKLQKALLSLLQERDYKSIRVHHIAERAGVSRNTFYRCYKNKNQVVLAIYDQAMTSFLEYLEQEIDAPDESEREDIIYTIVLLIFTGVYERLETSRLLFSAGIDDLIYSRFSLFFRRLVGLIIRRQHLHIKGDRLIQFLLSHLTGSAFHFMKEWILDENPPEPEEMARLYARILRPSIELISDLSE